VLATATSINSIFRGWHKIKKHRQETYVKSKLLECSWKHEQDKSSNASHTEEKSVHSHNSDGGGVELHVVRDSPAPSMTEVFGSFSMHNIMLRDINKEVDFKGDEGNNSQWRGLLSSCDLLEYEYSFIDSEVTLRQLLQLVAPKSTNSPASRDIANLVPILKEMGVTKLGHAMKLAQAVRKLRH
jgi:hypothetical protein